MKLLFDDSLAPITSEMGFFEIDSGSLVDAFKQWQGRVMTPLGIRVTERSVSGGLRQVLLQLLPLTGPRARRYLFIPTASGWVAFFDNGSGGSDPTSVAMYLTRVLSCRALRVAAVPHTLLHDRQTGGRYGACILELFGPQGDNLGYVRSVAVANDGGEWVFDQHGEPLPFEHVENYSRRRLTERFTFEDLRDYATALGLRPFDEDFYRADSARLVELTGTKPRGMVEVTLEQVRANF